MNEAEVTQLGTGRHGQIPCSSCRPADAAPSRLGGLAPLAHGTMSVHRHTHSPAVPLSPSGKRHI
jgi:hypothetical protein